MADDGAAARRFLTFRLDQRLYALPASDVSEVIRLPSVARVPQAPAGLLGLANLRGDVLPVASLRGLLGDPEGTMVEGRAIVFGDAAPVALAVDRVEALVSIAPEAVDAADLVAEGAERLGGAFETPAGVARILDLKAMLAQAFVVRARAPRAAVPKVAADATTNSVADRHGRRLVSFEVGGQEFAIPLEAVREVAPAAEGLAAAPGADAAVLGVTAYRGGLLPLMSLRALLGLGQAASDGQGSIVVTIVGGVLVGLVADRMRAVLSADPALIDPTPPVLAARIGGEAKVSAIYRGEAGRRLVSIIEPDQLFREEIMQRLGSTERSAPTDAADAGAVTGAQSLYLVFRLAGDDFALPIEAVDEVALAPSQITRLPKMPAFLEGVANLRGEVLPVVDQRRRFGMPEAADADLARRRMVVVRSERHRAGLIVDSVSEVLRADDDALQAPPDLTGEANRLVTGVINLEEAGRIVMVLDPAELLTRVEHGLLDAFAGELGASQTT